MTDELELVSMRDAMARVVEAGFTEQFDEGENGDMGPGSRLYFRRPGAPTNDYGWPLEDASISYFGRGRWAVRLPQAVAPPHITRHAPNDHRQ